MTTLIKILSKIQHTAPKPPKIWYCVFDVCSIENSAKTIYCLTSPTQKTTLIFVNIYAFYGFDNPACFKQVVTRATKDYESYGICQM